jgi:DNA-binding CsgD family transcriptional regulator
MTPLTKNPASFLKEGVVPFDFPVEKLTENILALSDAAVIITNGETIEYCTQSMISVLGIQRQTVIDQGWACLIDLMHPADIRLLKNKLLPEIRNHFRHLTEDERYSRTFNFTLRMRVGENEYALLAVENKPLKWTRKDWPSAYISILRDISPFGNKGEMLLNIYDFRGEKSYHSVLQRRYSFASEKFTGREAEIIRHITKGMTSNQIAETLCLSSETVRNHRKKIMRKAGCNSSSALTSLALQEGII